VKASALLPIGLIFVPFIVIAGLVPAIHVFSSS